MLVTRFGVGQNAPGRRDNGDAQAIAHDRQFLRTGINTTAGLRHPRNVLNRRLPLEILALPAHALALPHPLLPIPAHVPFPAPHPPTPNAPLPPPPAPPAPPPP